MELQTPPELREFIPRSFERMLSANSYRQRSEAIKISIDGEQSDWHSLKGGLNPQKSLTEARKNDITYETFYSIEAQKWLKIVPPESTTNDSNPTLELRLSRGVEIGKAALVAAGLDEFVDQFKLSLVRLKGKNVVGFISPHLGPSVQFFQRQLIQMGHSPFPSEAVEFFSQVYTIAYHQAVQLYSEGEYWTADPNPGNVLVHQDPKGNLRVVMIDFTSRDQIKPFKSIPYPKTQAKKKGTDMLALHDKFQRQCQKIGVALLE